MNEERKQKGVQLIASIVEYLQAGDESAEHMWSLLSALRGPDKIDKLINFLGSPLKAATTEKIRYAFGMRPNPNIPANIGDEGPEPLPTPSDVQRYPSGRMREYYKAQKFIEVLTEMFPKSDAHFLRHAAEAILALEKFDLISQRRKP